jgi:FlaA1/EpsC-like NDP-sugar epimerase
MGRYVMRGTQIFIDLLVLSAAYWLAFLFRFEFSPDLQTFKQLMFTWPYVVLFQYLVLVIFGVPSFSWRYVGVHEASRMFMSVGVSSIVLIALRLGFGGMGGYFKYITIPLGVLLMDFVMSFGGVAGIRLIRRIIAEQQERRRDRAAAAPSKRTLLIGAGRAGVLVAKEVQQNPHLGMNVIGFVDDDPLKDGTVIQGYKVLGNTASLPELVQKHKVEQAVITIASASGASIRRIVTECEKIDLPVKIIPGIYEILDGRVNLSRIREVQIEDLLGREAVELDVDLIGSFLAGKRVLVTGAGGSIGSELCRQVARFSPERLVLLEQAENALFAIHSELAKLQIDCEVVPVIADVCDSKRVDQVFDQHKPQVVFHAAAHKHVPMMEYNPGEAIKNNVFGTKKVADAADHYGSEAFVMISTDKAVNPTSIMGASKRVAEIYVQALSGRSKTKFVAVRFGNVLGSAGSVIPIFKEQIRNGGPVTVTHPDMMRYFMTIPEACQLVMQAASMGEGGEIFVLDMGEPVKIVDLARDLIRLSGFTEEEIPIQFMGVRQGEKLFEELAVSGEFMNRTRHPKIFIGKIAPTAFIEVTHRFELLASSTDLTSREEVRQALKEAVPEMQDPDGTTLDIKEEQTSPSSAMVH